jgi:hypothetical protein
VPALNIEVILKALLDGGVAPALISSNVTHGVTVAGRRLTRLAALLISR